MISDFTGGRTETGNMPVCGFLSTRVAKDEREASEASQGEVRHLTSSGRKGKTFYQLQLPRLHIRTLTFFL